MTINQKVGSSKPPAVGVARVARALKVKQKNPRMVRVLTALLARPHRREELDKIAGSSNVPDIMMRIKNGLGITFKCDFVDAFDRDNLPCQPGVYRLTEEGRLMAIQWLQPDSPIADEDLEKEPRPTLRAHNLSAVAALFSAAGPAQRGLS